MWWHEPHRRVAPPAPAPRLGPARNPEELAEERARDRHARVQLDRPPEIHEHLVAFAANRAPEGTEQVAVGFHRVAGDRSFGVLDESAHVGVAIDRPLQLKPPVVPVGEVGVGEAGCRVEPNRSGEQLDGLLAVLAGRAAEEPMSRL